MDYLVFLFFAPAISFIFPRYWKRKKGFSYWFGIPLGIIAGVFIGGTIASQLEQENYLFSIILIIIFSYLLIYCKKHSEYTINKKLENITENQPQDQNSNVIKSELELLPPTNEDTKIDNQSDLNNLTQIKNKNSKIDKGTHLEKEIDALKGFSSNYIFASKPAPTQDKIQFWYTDFEGNLTKRNVRIKSLDDEYLEAFDLDKQGDRTFRVERIDDEVIDLTTGEILSKMDWLNSHGIFKINKRGYKPKELVKYDLADKVCFTGFSKADRERLENLAEVHGYTIRKSVTVKLKYLVCGSNAGPSKIAQAESLGVILLDEEEFLYLLEAGSVPD